MKRFAGWLLSSLGYLLYTLVVLVVLLWFLFPVDKVRVRLQAGMNAAGTDARWEIAGLHKAWPLSIVASGVRFREGENGGEPLILIDELKVTPAVQGLLTMGERIPVRYQLRFLDGTVRGNGEYHPADGLVRGEGHLENLDLTGLDEIWRKMNRKAAGIVSGRFSVQGAWGNLSQLEGQADLVVSDGHIDLYQPFFGLPQLTFSRMRTVFNLRDGVVTLEQGDVESKMLAAEYAGTVTLANPPGLSEIKVNGSLEPRPELLGGIKDRTALALIRNQLKENRLSFAVSGTLLEPGIAFEGTSGVIDGIIQGGAR
ncbi:MAG: type II secretion system protein GspN [Desulfobulbaceae bacterium]|jgi:type II secretion system protein N|nr:type II secretion system protein GspN [Desulfobulbaceae bacterium]MDY0350873.1 type II secretion system protein GspN [Desulfobulbaceae bacterium]